MRVNGYSESNNVLHIELTGMSGGALRVNLFNSCTDGVIVFSICMPTVLLHIVNLLSTSCRWPSNSLMPFYTNSNDIPHIMQMAIQFSNVILHIQVVIQFCNDIQQIIQLAIQFSNGITSHHATSRNTRYAITAIIPSPLCTCVQAKFRGMFRKPLYSIL